MKRRILLVDDDVAVLLTLKAVLEMNQFDVETASSGAEAVKKMRSARMETEDAGFHVLRAARKQRYNPATALLTAFPPVDGDWKEAGAQTLLVKPVGTKDLLRQIEALLIGHEDEKRGQNKSPRRQTPAAHRARGKRVS
jgi:DNA-binding response OmpR family regulator